MKFGEQLRREAIPEWQKMYLDYESLKQLLRQITYSWRCQATSSTSTATLQSCIFSPLSETEFLFIKHLDDELQKVDDFYREKEEEFSRSKFLLEQALHYPSDRKRTEQLRRACLEMYRGLGLLNAYRRLNKLGFRKIITARAYASQFMQQVADKRLFSSQSHLSLLVRGLEDTYTTKFAAGDRHAAMLELRLPSDIQYLGGRLHHRSSFMGGFYLGGSFFLLLFILFNLSLFDLRLLFLTSVAIGLPLMLLWGVLIIELICDYVHISFGFIFEFDPRDSLSVSERSELLSFTTFLVLFGIICFSLLNIAIFPLLLLLVLLLVLLMPVPCYFSSRFYLLRLLFGTIASLIKGPIKFRHFYFGDALMSLGMFTRTPIFFMILYQDYFSTLQAKLPASVDVQELWKQTGAHLVPLLFFSSFPAFLRILQSLRRYWDDRKRSSKTHLLNALKYSASLVANVVSVVMFSMLHELHLSLWITWMMLSIISSLFSLYWDMVMDWGFSLQANGTILLRDRGLLVGGGRRYPYYLLILVNAALRFTWSIPVINAWMVLLVAFGEVFRRALWTLFRLEHEHLNNCGEFKAIHAAEEFGISSSPASNEDDLFPPNSTS